MLDIDDTVFSLVFVNDKLTCESPIEVPYYVAFADPLCFFCGSEVELVIREDFYPLCSECQEKGCKPHKKITRAFRGAKSV